jgi:hypothetical protein
VLPQVNLWLIQYPPAAGAAAVAVERIDGFSSESRRSVRMPRRRSGMHDGPVKAYFQNQGRVNWPIKNWNALEAGGR